MKTIYILLLGLLITSSCSTSRPEGKTEAEVLFQEAETFIADERYLLAIEKLNKIRSQYPYSYYATHAELLNADVLFNQENYADSAAAYIVFKDFHPKHKRRAYVLFKIAESFYHQLPDTFDRDLSPGFESKNYYRELLRDFPTSDFTKSAQDKISLIDNMIKKKEKYIADFYFKTDVYDAARFHYLSILRDFSDSMLKDHSMVRIIQASAILDDKENCKRYFYDYKEKISTQKKTDLEEAFEGCTQL
jgi:outer membrane protein assembly factor BamD